MRPGCRLGVLSVQGLGLAVWVLSQTSYSCAAVFTNPKAFHSIKQWVRGRAEGLRVATAALKPGRKKEREREGGLALLALAKERKKERERERERGTIPLSLALAKERESETVTPSSCRLGSHSTTAPHSRALEGEVASMSVRSADVAIFVRLRLDAKNSRQETISTGPPSSPFFSGAGNSQDIFFVVDVLQADATPTTLEASAGNMLT